MSAWTELIDYLEPGETVEAIVFGAWGWGDPPDAGQEWNPEYGEPDPPPVPYEMRGRVLSLADAEPMMQTWDISGDFGAPECYAMRVWTSDRILWVTRYDGATWLTSSPRFPRDGYFPDMPGGG